MYIKLWVDLITTNSHCLQTDGRESSIKKVLLFTYSRGGSTLLYETLNHDARAMAWYEPLGPLYGYLYGLPLYRPYTRIVRQANKLRSAVIILIKNRYHISIALGTHHRPQNNCHRQFEGVVVSIYLKKQKAEFKIAKFYDISD